MCKAIALFILLYTSYLIYLLLPILSWLMLKNELDMELLLHEQ